MQQILPIILKNVIQYFAFWPFVRLVIVLVLNSMFWQFTPWRKFHSLERINLLYSSLSLKELLTGWWVKDLFKKDIGISRLPSPLQWIIYLELLLFKLTELLGYALVVYLLRLIAGISLWSFFGIDIISTLGEYIHSVIPGLNLDTIINYLNDLFLIPLLGISLRAQLEDESLLLDGIQAIHKTNSEIKETLSRYYPGPTPDYISEYQSDLINNHISSVEPQTSNNWIYWIGGSLLVVGGTLFLFWYFDPSLTEFYHTTFDPKGKGPEFSLFEKTVTNPYNRFTHYIHDRVVWTWDYFKNGKNSMNSREYIPSASEARTNELHDLLLDYERLGPSSELGTFIQYHKRSSGNLKAYFDHYKPHWKPGYYSYVKDGTPKLQLDYLIRQLDFEKEASHGNHIIQFMAKAREVNMNLEAILAGEHTDQAHDLIAGIFDKQLSLLVRSFDGKTYEHVSQINPLKDRFTAWSVGWYNYLHSGAVLNKAEQLPYINRYSDVSGLQPRLNSIVRELFKVFPKQDLESAIPSAGEK